MSEKLTVAELLARNGRGDSAQSGTRRRRRRSLDDGGITVAELTGSIPVVAEKPEGPAKKQQLPKPAAAGPTAPKPAAKPAAPKSAVKPEVAAKPAAKSAAAGSVAPKPVAKPVAPKSAVKPEVAAKPAAKPVAPKSAVKSVIAAKPAAPKPVAKSAAPKPVAPVEQILDGVPKEFHEDDRLAELQADLQDGEILEFEDDRISWPMMLLQALGGIAGGMALFLAFGWLWETLPTIAVLALALVVTLCLVGLVHVMLRHKDRMLMVLAFFVGIVLTVGPRIIMGI